MFGQGAVNKHEIHISVKTDLCFVIVCHFDIQLEDMDFVHVFVLYMYFVHVHDFVHVTTGNVNSFMYVVDVR